MTNFSPTDWRALCAELVTALRERIDDKSMTSIPQYVNAIHLIDRTNTALAHPEPQGSMADRYQALIYAGYMADLALGLVGGQGLNGTVYPVHPDKFSDLAKKLRHAAEQYNNHILEMYRRLND